MSIKTKTRTAWESIGWDDGKFKIKGGRAEYEAVMYNCHNDGRLVKLARLDMTEHGIKEVSRYVEPETILEFLKAESTGANECQTNLNEAGPGWDGD